MPTKARTISPARLVEAVRAGKLSDYAHRIDEFDRTHLDALLELYDEELPLDADLGTYVGHLEQLVRGQETEAQRNAANQAAVAQRLAVNQQYRERSIKIGGGEFWDVLAAEFNNVCPGPGDPHAIPRHWDRIGQWHWLCLRCGFEGDALPLWRKQLEAVRDAA